MNGAVWGWFTIYLSEIIEIIAETTLETTIETAIKINAESSEEKRVETYIRGISNRGGRCKFGVIQCKFPSQNGPARLDIPLRDSPNYVF